MVLKAYKSGNGWLYEILIVKLKTFSSFNDFQKEFERKDLKEVRVRDEGGRLVVLTFKSDLHMKEARIAIDEWIFDWCESISDWEKKVVDQTRKVCVD